MLKSRFCPQFEITSLHWKTRSIGSFKITSCDALQGWFSKVFSLLWVGYALPLLPPHHHPSRWSDWSMRTKLKLFHVLFGWHRTWFFLSGRRHRSLLCLVGINVVGLLDFSCGMGVPHPHPPHCFLGAWLFHLGVCGCGRCCSSQSVLTADHQCRRKSMCHEDNHYLYVERSFWRNFLLIFWLFKSPFLWAIVNSYFLPTVN